MRPITLSLMPLLFSLGCAGPGTSSTDRRVELPQEACPSYQSAANNVRESSNACRPQRSWLEEAGNALGGFATAVRISNQ